MLQGLKRWLGGSSANPRGFDALGTWAESRQYGFRAAKDIAGFMVDGRLGTLPWRLEWGPSQRPYVQGPELRLRAEIGVSNDLQVLLLNRNLQEQMEKAVFEQYVEGVQTRIDNQTPPEMRWLVMFPKLANSELGLLRDRYAGLSSQKTWLSQWIAGPLSGGLIGAPGGPERPLVLMIARGRMTLRTGLEQPTPEQLEAWIQLFETAMREARRVTLQMGDVGAPSTQPSLFSASALPGDDGKAR